MENIIERILEFIDSYAEKYAGSLLADDLVQLRLKFPSWFETRFQTIRNQYIKKIDDKVSIHTKSGKFILRLVFYKKGHCRVHISFNGNKASTIKSKDLGKMLELDPGYVYFIYSQYGWKIGKTRNVHIRMKTFDVKLPFDFELRYYITTNQKGVLEVKFHRFFKDKRINGEWFDISEKDIIDACESLAINNLKKKEEFTKYTEDL